MLENKEKRGKDREGRREGERRGEEKRREKRKRGGSGGKRRKNKYNHLL